MQGQTTAVHGNIPFPSGLLKDDVGHSILVNALQLAKAVGFDNSIGWGKRSTWFVEQYPSFWFDVDQQGMFSR